MSDIYSNFYPRPPRGGRRTRHSGGTLLSYFYPRPPRGGRRSKVYTLDIAHSISIHALREEGDGAGETKLELDRISINALREEGDILPSVIISSIFIFLSTPSARRATQPSVALAKDF